MRPKQATAVLINDTETMKIVNQFASKDNRTPTNAARELIKRGLNTGPSNTDKSTSLKTNSQPQSSSG